VTPATTPRTRHLLNARSKQTIGRDITKPAAPLHVDTNHDAKAAPKQGPSQSERLVQLALERYSFHLTPEGEPYAVERDGPNIARMFRGGRDGLRAWLAREFRQRYEQTPTHSALSDALTVCEGYALDADPQPVALRVARHGHDVVIDLGDASGAAVVVSDNYWRLEDRSPVLFRRTVLTGALPTPEHGGSVSELRGLLNVSDAAWPLLLGWIVATFIPDIPHPVLSLVGEQGAGKSSAARTIVDLTDPSPAPLRSEPRDLEGWAVAASGSHVVALDNISSITPWLSDALCRAVTDDAIVKRRLYSDNEQSILRFRRCVMLTSIDPGALRGDLADRLVLVGLQHIAPDRRRTETEINASYHDCRPFVFGALLDVLAAVLAELPNVDVAGLPRMADFARVLAALDRAAPELTNGNALASYLGQSGRLADDVIEGDPFGEALRRMLDAEGSWCGRASDLLKKLEPEHPARGWPGTARGVSARLLRLVPALRQIGWTVDIPSERTNHGRVISISKTATSAHPTLALRVMPGTNGDDEAETL
jgi:hypothetical protein